MEDFEKDELEHSCPRKMLHRTPRSTTIGKATSSMILLPRHHMSDVVENLRMRSFIYDQSPAKESGTIPYFSLRNSRILKMQSSVGSPGRPMVSSNEPSHTAPSCSEHLCNRRPPVSWVVAEEDGASLVVPSIPPIKRLKVRLSDYLSRL